MQSALTKLGLKCTRLLDATKRQMTDAITAFIESLKHSDVVFIYYSGHGEDSAGSTYLLPTDYGSSKSLVDDAVSLNDLMQRLNHLNCNLINIIVLDCCRANEDDSTFRGSSRSASSARAPSDSFVRRPTSGQFFIAFSADPGTVAQESERNGWFTGCLLEHLLTPGLRLTDVFHHAADALQKKAEGEQRAWVNQTPGTKLGHFVNRES